MNRTEISILIPTYDNLQFIENSLSSILESCEGYDYEILIGIDGCNKSQDYFKNRKKNEKIRIFFSNQNVGPYLIRNSLAKLATKCNLLFFDSDDLMEKNMIRDVLSKIDENSYVRTKHLRVFENEQNVERFSDCQILIERELFLNLKGYEPWPIAADSDFINRLKKQKIKKIETKILCFKKTIHQNSLTRNNHTGLGTPIRKKFIDLVLKRNGNYEPKEFYTINLEEL